MRLTINQRNKQPDPPVERYEPQSGQAPVPAVEPCFITPREHAIPAYESAIRCKRVSLDQLIEARFGTLVERPQTAQGSHSVHPSYFPRLLEAYVAEHGKIEESYFCKRIRGAAILTVSETPKSLWRKDVALRIHLRYPPDAVVGVTPEFEAALWKCMALSKKATQLLRTQNSRMLHKIMHSTVVYLLTVLDTIAGENEDLKTTKTQQAVAEAHRELDHAARQYRDCASWGAQLAYSKGLLIGLVFLLLLGGVIAAAAGIPTGGRLLSSPVLHHLLLCLLGGGLGGVVSVMYRMTSHKFRPNQYTEHKSLMLLASFRPLIGAVFALAIYVLIWGGFLTMAPPRSSNPYYFVAGIAFLSGFSERFAQVSLAGAAKTAEEEASTARVPADRGASPAGSTVRRRRDSTAPAARMA